MRPMRMDPSSLPAIQHQVSYLIAGNGDTSVHFSRNTLFVPVSHSGIIAKSD
jgi:hypothetical protein